MLCTVAEGTFSIAYGPSASVYNKACHFQEQNCLPCQSRTNYPGDKVLLKAISEQNGFLTREMNARINTTATLNTEVHAKFILSQLPGAHQSEASSTQVVQPPAPTCSSCTGTSVKGMDGDCIPLQRQQDTVCMQTFALCFA